MFLSVTEAEGGTTKPCFASDREDAMDNSKTPKIVVGIGLAAVYSGLAFYFLRGAWKCPSALKYVEGSVGHVYQTWPLIPYSN